MILKIHEFTRHDLIEEYETSLCRLLHCYILEKWKLNPEDIVQVEQFFDSQLQAILVLDDAITYCSISFALCNMTHDLCLMKGVLHLMFHDACPMRCLITYDLCPMSCVSFFNSWPNWHFMGFINYTRCRLITSSEQGDTACILECWKLFSKQVPFQFTFGFYIFPTKMDHKSIFPPMLVRQFDD